jgi:hypothetical protein
MTTPGYVTVPIGRTATDIETSALTALAASLPGWVPRDSNLEVWLLESMAQMVSETSYVAAQVPDAIFKTFGQTLLNLPPLAGSAATMASTWSFSDTAGHTIPAGTRVSYPGTGSTPLIFTVKTAVTVAAGSNITVAGGVTLVAPAVGVIYNGLAAASLVLSDNLAYVTTITSVGSSAGGVDAETDAAYLVRLVADLKLLAPRPILPSDFAALATNQAGVARATAIDGYNPVDSSTGNARMVAVACVDTAGAALTTGLTATVSAYLQSLREVNFVVNVIAPTSTAIDVSATVVTTKGASINMVSTAITAAINNYLLPANWGGPAPLWTNLKIVHYLKLASIISDVPNVAYVSLLQLALGGGTLGSGDVTLPGVAPLPRPGAINVVVTAGT